MPQTQILKRLIEEFLKELSNDYGFLFFSMQGLSFLSERGMNGKKFSDVPSFTLAEGHPNNQNSAILYHETGKIIHDNICNKYPSRMMRYFIPDPSLEKNSLTKLPLVKVQKSSCKTLDL